MKALVQIPFLIGLLSVLSSVRASEVGRDVAEVFSRAERGAPLRYVALGGSITQAGEGWISGWLKHQFPRSQVMAVNSGMSGTGSSLGVFRIERDVIAYQPDLVAIEFCVNDLGTPDEDTIRYMESLIVRLKSLPHPPAIIILEAAMRNGVNLSRHRRVAQHYGLLEVDLQAATVAHLKDAGLTWADLFGDAVHPKRAGHAFYQTVIEKALQPYIEKARRVNRSEDGMLSLPTPLSTKPLILDGRMMPLQALRGISPEWTSEPAPQADWARFFQGVLTAHQPGALLEIPFRGTAVGLFFVVKKENGSFYMNVDGGVPKHVAANGRDGFTSVILASDLPAREHRFALALPPREEVSPGEPPVNGPVELGYLLVAGDKEASREQSPQGSYGIETLKKLRFRSVPASAWWWTGPFVGEEKGPHVFDAQKMISQSFLGEEDGQVPRQTVARPWTAVTEQSNSLVDLRALTGAKEPAVAYAETQFSSAKGGTAILSLDVDYYAQVWLNGKLVLTLDGPHSRPVFLPVTLAAGDNALLCKVGAGSDGFSVRLKIAEPGAEIPRP